MRFGRDKMGEPFRGVPLLHHAILGIAQACDEVVVVIAPRAPVPELPAEPSIRVVRDAVEGEGPLAGVSAGLAEVRTEVSAVVGGDMPGLSRAVLNAMVQAVAGGGAAGPVEAVALRDTGSLRPLPLALRTRPAREATGALLSQGERSLLSLLSALRTSVLEEEQWVPLDPERATLRDVDAPEDLGPEV